MKTENKTQIEIFSLLIIQKSVTHWFNQKYKQKMSCITISTASSTATFSWRNISARQILLFEKITFFCMPIIQYFYINSVLVNFLRNILKWKMGSILKRSIYLPRTISKMTNLASKFLTFHGGDCIYIYLWVILDNILMQLAMMKPTGPSKMVRT